MKFWVFYKSWSKWQELAVSLIISDAKSAAGIFLNIITFVKSILITLPINLRS